MKKLVMLAVIVTLNCSAYCDCGVTASGEPVRAGICAMDMLNGVMVPFGSRVTLQDGTVLVVKDRLGGKYNNRLDIWIPKESACRLFGRKDLKCEVQLP